jgi:hypothetical protein|tara:strand:+ start:1571 stop:1765 length:195 start_codon:yes stop_codon:yes gene_type:complete
MFQNYIDITDKTLLVPVGMYQNQTIKRVNEIIRNYDKSLFDVTLKQTDKYYIVKIQSKINIKGA